MSDWLTAIRNQNPITGRHGMSQMGGRPIHNQQPQQGDVYSAIDQLFSNEKCMGEDLTTLGEVVLQHKDHITTIFNILKEKGLMSPQGNIKPSRNNKTEPEVKQMNEEVDSYKIRLPKSNPFLDNASDCWQDELLPKEPKFNVIEDEVFVTDQPSRFHKWLGSKSSKKAIETI